MLVIMSYSVWIRSVNISIIVTLLMFALFGGQGDVKVLTGLTSYFGFQVNVCSIFDTDKI